MIKIEEFSKYNFNITWKVIYLGFKGSCIYANQFLASDIIEYAINQLNTECVDGLLYELAGEYKKDTEEIHKLLKELSEKEKVDDGIEARKLRFILVAHEIAHKNDNFLNGLMDLSDLWIKLGYPEDSPHIFQGEKNNITPEQYYTQNNYDRIFNRHIIWMGNEIELILNKQNEL